MENSILARFAPNSAKKTRKLVRSLIANRSDDDHGFVEDSWGLGDDLEQLRKSAATRKGPTALKDRIVTCTAIIEELAPSWCEADTEGGCLMDIVSETLDDLMNIARNYKNTATELAPLRSWAFANLDSVWAHEGDGWDAALLELFIKTSRSEEEIGSSLAECEKRCDPGLPLERGDISADRAAELMLVALRGKGRSEARRRFITEHLDLAPVRRAAIEAAIATRDFDAAEALARTGIEQCKKHGQLSSSHDFSMRLIQVFETRGDKATALSVIEKWTIEEKSLGWYDEIRKRLRTRESRAEIRDRIIAATSKRDDYFVAAICAREGLVDRLHQIAQANKNTMANYYREIGKKYPESAAGWLESFLRKDLTRTHSRNGYIFCADRLKEYTRFAGYERGRALAAELIETYPRRPAMRDELEKAVKALGRKGASLAKDSKADSKKGCLDEC